MKYSATNQRIGPDELVRNIEQAREHADGHEEGIDDQGAGQTKELADNELPSANRARKHGIKCALFDLFGDQTDADKNGDHDAKQGNRREPEVDDDQFFDVDRNLAHQDGRSRQQNGESDEVVEHAVSHRFAKSIGRNVHDARFHAILPAVVSARCSFSTK
jgi:hypothetical protein